MKIVIVNQPMNNRGDESAHKALVRALIKSVPSLQVSIIWVGANQNSIDQYNVGADNVKYVNLKPYRGFTMYTRIVLRYNLYLFWYLHPTVRKIIKYYKEADWILSAPGGICMGGFQNWRHLFFLKLAKFLKKDLVYYGRSFGPFPTETKSNRVFKRISIEMLNYCSFISIRDAKTEHLADELGIKYVPTIDTAFLDSPLVKLPTELRQQIGTKSYVVFVPNSLIWHYAFKNKLSENDVLSFYKGIFLKIISAYKDCNVILLPQTFNNGNSMDDIRFFYSFKEYIADNRIIVINDCYSSDIQQTIISNACCMIGARYHSIVFAINNSIPFVALSYEHKISGLLEKLNKQEQMVEISASTLKDDNRRSIIIEEFGLKLSCVASDNGIKDKAKQIAEKCFHSLASQLLKKQDYIQISC